jgi:hypothetical protein
MIVILLFLPRGILPSLTNWWEERRTPRAAHTGARTMSEMYDEKNPKPQAVDEPGSTTIIK